MGFGEIGVELIGSRVTIRLKEATGGFRDIVGILETLTSLQKSDGTVATFNPSEIAIWRKIETPTLKAGQGAPYSLRIREMELIADASWESAEKASVGDWLLRADGKFTYRANSVLPTGAAPWGEPGSDLDAALISVVDFYRSRNLKPIFQVPLPLYEELDRKLESDGWQAGVTMNYMIADLEESYAVSDNYRESTQPSPEWLAVQADEGTLPIMERTNARYGWIENNGAIAAVGRAGLVKDWCVLARIFVPENLRGKGYAKSLMGGLLDSARRAGATKALLQVDSENAPAIALYEKFGFRTHHQGRFRILEKTLPLISECC